MLDKYPSLIVDRVARLVAPVIQLFAFYVITHGHYSPGGGFQGGVLLAASTLLLRITLGREEARRLLPPRAAVILAAVGVTVYAVIGVVPLALGGEYLNYAFLPSPGTPAPVLRYYGILAVEIGVALAVWGTLVAIFDRLTEEEG